jgi:hypothetical protein
VDVDDLRAGNVLLGPRFWHLDLVEQRANADVVVVVESSAAEESSSTTSIAAAVPMTCGSSIAPRVTRV